MLHPTDRITHTTAFVTPVVGHLLSPNGSTDPTTHRPTNERSYHGLHLTPYLTLATSYSYKLITSPGISSFNKTVAVEIISFSSSSPSSFSSSSSSSSSSSLIMMMMVITMMMRNKDYVVTQSI